MKNPISINIAKEINSTIVMHPRFKKAHDGIIRIIETAILVEIPFGATVIAPPGCGKTALIKSIQLSLPSHDFMQEGTASLSVAAEANASVGNLVSKLLRQIGYPTTIRTSTIHEQSSLLASAMRQRGVRAIFIDESQHIFRGKRTLSAAGITDWIKQLSDEAGVVIIMLGTPDLKSLDETNDQLSSRTPAHFELREFELNNDWLGLLKQLASNVKSFDISSIYTTHYKNLHKITRGALRPLKQLLITSAVHAASNSKPSLDLDSLSFGHMQVFGTDPRNPNLFENELIKSLALSK
jgi:hypothetical protein